jgi:predicted DNA-binding transcriptional regulator YafY
VVLRISPALAPCAEERFWHATARQHRLADGSLRIELEVCGDEVLQWVRTMGKDVELVSPPELRAQLTAELRATLDQYGC